MERAGAKQELAEQWRRTKWDAEDEKQRRKAEAKKALVLQQQRGLDAQVSGGDTQAGVSVDQ